MTTRDEYVNEKNKYAYKLSQEHKFFKKARALVLCDGKLCVIKVTHEDGKIYYLLPGGGVDPGETAPQAAIREAHEEFGVVVKNPKYVGRQYYHVGLTYGGTQFRSNRVEYYYVFNLDAGSKFDNTFGLEGEFAERGDNYEKVTLSYADVKRTPPEQINKMSKKVYESLLELMQQKSAK